MSSTLPIAAGTVATLVFAASTLADAGQGRPHQGPLRPIPAATSSSPTPATSCTRFYVFHLPPGPIWLLHTFYAATSALMLFWSLRFGPPPAGTRPAGHRRSDMRTPAGSTEHIETVIIGAGQAGLATAYHLQRLGRRRGGDPGPPRPGSATTGGGPDPDLLRLFARAQATSRSAREGPLPPASRRGRLADSVVAGRFDLSRCV